jgi:maltose alpha-D-glucosyltransferase / alpha-amylase
MTFQQVDAQFVGRLRNALAAQLPVFLPKQRWFGAKAKQIQSVHLAEYFPIPLPQSLALIALARVEYSEDPGENYVLPLLAADPAADLPPDSVIARLPVAESAAELLLIDALGNPDFLNGILDSLRRSISYAGENGSLQAAPEPALQESGPGSAMDLPPRLLKAEQSNTSIIYGNRLILKFFRRVEEGVNPDLEIGHFLTAVARFANVPPLCGSMKYESREGKSMTLGILQGFVPNRGDAWRFTVESLTELFARSHDRRAEGGAGSKRNSAGLPEEELSKEASDLLAGQLELIGLLGKRTAELHLALTSSSADPAFAPEPFTPEIRESMDSSFHDMAVRNFNTLRQNLTELPESVTEPAKNVLKMEDDALLALHSILGREITSLRSRIHGDYHLGQVLFTGSDFFIIDFEGEPARPLSERRYKRSPLQDVAGMLRSFHYAAHSASRAVQERLALPPESDAFVKRLAGRWQSLASREFLQSYRKTAGGARFLPANPSEFDGLLKVHLLEKAIYELGYELNNRPSWVAIPLEGIEEILAIKA